MKQYSQASMTILLVGPAFSFDQGILQAVGKSALGVRNSSQWNKDIDNAAIKSLLLTLKATMVDFLPCTQAKAMIPLI